MAPITIRGQTLDIDVREELEAFDWERARWTNEKLVAVSPFRDDRSPSFFVRLEATESYDAGLWADSGAIDDYYAKGGLVKLLAYLRHESNEMTEAYLLDKYGVPDDGALVLRPTTFRLTTKQRFAPSEYNSMTADTSTYMLGRGITPQVQSVAGIRHDSEKVAIPWHKPNGTIATVKYRMVNRKSFWYASGGTPVERLLYGINNVWARRSKVAVLCEGEIDALSWEVAGFTALAIGGSAFTNYKRDLIVASPIETLLLATDNDSVGERLRAYIREALPRSVNVIDVRSNANYKDSNEVLTNEGVSGLLQLVGSKLD